MQLLISSLQIIVHAPSDATDTLIESCGNIRAMTKDIFAPAVGENVQIGQQTNTFSISLTDELLSSIKMSRVRSAAHMLITKLMCLLYSLKTTRWVS